MQADLRAEQKPPTIRNLNPFLTIVLQPRCFYSNWFLLSAI